MKKLTDSEIAAALAQLLGWKREGDALVKTFELATFARNIEVVGAIARHADKIDHHPDMLIQYRKLTCTLSTHDAGGITAKDVELAKAIELLAK
jgi:4a-hydroxytetrahydrobiopterin dehydratase